MKLTNEEIKWFNEAINDLVPDAKYRLARKNDGYIIFQWEDSRPQPTINKIIARGVELKSEYDANAPERNRWEQYPIDKMGALAFLKLAFPNNVEINEKFLALKDKVIDIHNNT